MQGGIREDIPRGTIIYKIEEHCLVHGCTPLPLVRLERALGHDQPLEGAAAAAVLGGVDDGVDACARDSDALRTL